MTLTIEPLRRYVTDDPLGDSFTTRPMSRDEVEAALASGRPLVFLEASNRDVVVDEHGSPVATTRYADPARERVAASVEVAIRQGRIPRSRAQHFLDLGERAIDLLLAQPIGRFSDDEDLYRAHAEATGVRPIERPTLAPDEQAYATFAAVCGVSTPGTLPPTVEGRLA